ncbi:hypothetical protein PLICRDRAFT_612159 [Plicaturopsis crispa FD-325 SS-3]|nr:hypothetical protein PLICRDRAFT_612159 [Plicaturopsis crispa FD-325 SS-3]
MLIARMTLSSTSRGFPGVCGIFVGRVFVIRRKAMSSSVRYVSLEIFYHETLLLHPRCPATVSLCGV